MRYLILLSVFLSGCSHEIPVPEEQAHYRDNSTFIPGDQGYNEVYPEGAL